MDDIADADLASAHSRHVSLEMPAAIPKPALNEMEIDGVVYRVAISLCPGDDFGKDLVMLLIFPFVIVLSDKSRDNS